MRFDLVINDDLQVFLMEANMSPNLSSAHFPPNQLLYEQVIYHTLRLLGIGSNIYRESLRPQGLATENMISTDKNIVINAEICAQLPCTESCAPEQCQFCRSCLTKTELNEMHAAYREHVNRGDTKRIFPVPLKSQKTKLNEKYLDSLLPKNQFMTKWFYGKCQMDAAWC